jgi:hypothetical protein
LTLSEVVLEVLAFDMARKRVKDDSDLRSARTLGVKRTQRVTHHVKLFQCHSLASIDRALPITPPTPRQKTFIDSWSHTSHTKSLPQKHQIKLRNIVRANNRKIPGAVPSGGGAASCSGRGLPGGIETTGGDTLTLAGASRIMTLGNVRGGEV